uniref:Knottin scorpion toxin-like domain-containing protein n=1 Tax=Brassica oleracea var. oleracea TaxID=109376 RepID=A0A0D3AYM6_BRAOL
MATKKIPSLLLFSLVVFLISLPIISGVYCTPKGPCEDTKKCNIHCLLLGYKDGGVCDTFGTTFCCCITSEGPPISNLPEH